MIARNRTKKSSKQTYKNFQPIIKILTLKNFHNVIYITKNKSNSLDFLAFIFSVYIKIFLQLNKLFQLKFN